MATITAVEVGAMDSIEKTESDVERSVCGFLREPFAFWSFQLTAGAPDAKRIRTIPRIERLSFTTHDGRSLGGYKLRAVAPWGYLTLLEKPLNASIQNDTFPGKLSAYSQSRILLTRAIAGTAEFGANTSLKRAVASLKPYATWHPIQIEDRQLTLAKLARRVWGLDITSA